MKMWYLCGKISEYGKGDYQQHHPGGTGHHT